MERCGPIAAGPMGVVAGSWRHGNYSLMEVCVQSTLLLQGQLCSARPGPKHFLTRFLLGSNKKHATMDTIA